MSTDLARSELTIRGEQSIWKNKQFLFLWCGNSISNLTFHIFTLAIPIIIYDLTQSTLAMSTMRTIEIIPNVLLGMLIGVIVDRFNRKKLMLGFLTIEVIMIASLIFLIFSSSLQLWHLYLIGFLIYTSGYAFGNAYHTILPLIMSKDQLTSANSALSFFSTLINIIGPAFAGFVLLYMSHTFGLSITVIGTLILLLLTSFIQLPDRHKGKLQNNKNGIWHDMKEGWEQLVSTKEL
jgi:MFS family permease